MDEILWPEFQKINVELSALDNFVLLFRVILVSAEIAKAGGLYRREKEQPESGDLMRSDFQI